jgi:hypothetical protein
MYFLKYGVTWYEKYFGFEPESKYKKVYNDAKKSRIDLLDIGFVSTQPCDFFDFETLTEIFKYMRISGFSEIVWTKKL